MQSVKGKVDFFPYDISSYKLREKVLNKVMNQVQFELMEKIGNEVFNHIAPQIWRSVDDHR